MPSIATASPAVIWGHPMLSATQTLSVALTKETRISAVSELLPEKGYGGPFPVFCTTLNLTFGEDLAWQERKAASFAFTPLYLATILAGQHAKGTPQIGGLMDLPGPRPILP